MILFLFLHANRPGASPWRHGVPFFLILSKCEPTLFGIEILFERNYFSSEFGKCYCLCLPSNVWEIVIPNLLYVTFFPLRRFLSFISNLNALKFHADFVSPFAFHLVSSLLCLVFDDLLVLNGPSVT